VIPGQKHRVPSSNATRVLVGALRHADRSALVVASPLGGILSNMGLTAKLRSFRSVAGTGAPGNRATAAKRGWNEQGGRRDPDERQHLAMVSFRVPS
jgi:hypothetical protein